MTRRSPGDSAHEPEARRREEARFLRQVADAECCEVRRRLAAGDTWEDIEQDVGLSRHILRAALEIDDPGEEEPKP